MHFMTDEHRNKHTHTHTSNHTYENLFLAYSMAQTFEICLFGK